MNDQDFEEKFAKMNIWADELRNDLVSLITNNPASIVYHYTDVNGLIGILSTGCIRATHVNRLNDTSENIHGFELVHDHVSQNMPKESRPLFDKVLSEFYSVDTYVSCYSTENDQLSQWREYTGSQVGYCLGFETSQMATIDDRLPPLESVIYKENQVKNLLNLLLVRVNEFFINNPTFGEIEVGHVLGTVSATLNSIACITKHPKFEEEKEYRHIYQPGKTGLNLSPCFRSGRFGLTPYVEINFLKPNFVPLKSITISPCNNFDLEKKELEIFLQKQGYENIKIEKSSIPLRR